MTTTQTTTIEILGHVFHDAPIADCRHCGQPRLRRLVRVRLNGAEMNIGFNCAAELTGEPVATVRSRAKSRQTAADKAAEKTWHDWNLRRRRHILWVTDAGSVPRPSQADFERADATFRAEEPEPRRPASCDKFVKLI